MVTQQPKDWTLRAAIRDQNIEHQIWICHHQGTFYVACNCMMRTKEGALSDNIEHEHIAEVKNLAEAWREWYEHYGSRGR